MYNYRLSRSILFFVIFILSVSVQANIKKIIVDINALQTNGVGNKIGTIEIEETKWGLLFIPHLKNLTLGIHGFHIHENPSCQPAKKDGYMVAGLAAGGHYDLDHTGKHLGPYGNGHLGDLPVLYVNHQGNATLPVLAPRLKSIKQIKGRSLMIHAGGDNYSDDPPMGGGGARFACGVIH